MASPASLGGQAHIAMTSLPEAASSGSALAMDNSEEASDNLGAPVILFDYACTTTTTTTTTTSTVVKLRPFPTCTTTVLRTTTTAEPHLTEKAGMGRRRVGGWACGRDRQGAGAQSMNLRTSLKYDSSEDC